MDRLFPEGALVFEVGAGAGNMVATLLEHGAGKVVAVEPGPRILYDLQARFGQDERVIVVPKAVGVRPGTERLTVHSGLLSGSTLVPEVAWGPDTLYSAYRPGVYDQVEVTTLDALVEAHGIPAFVNLTVVGYEWQALCGLTALLPRVAFSVTHATILAGWAGRAVDRIVEIAPKATFNYGDRDALRYDEQGALYVPPLRWAQWKDAEYVKGILPEVDDPGLWGRIHARMV